MQEANSSTLNTRLLTMSGLAVALCTVLSQIAIPLPVGVPISLGTLGIVLVGLVFGARRGAFIAFAYILMGAIGIPVFSGFQGGLGMFAGFSGGFIYSYPLLAFLAGLGRELSESPNKTKLSSLLSRDIKAALPWLFLILGTLANYLFGLSHFAFVTGTTILEAIPVVVAPFILGDLAKLALAMLLSRHIRKVIFPTQHIQ